MAGIFLRVMFPNALASVHSANTYFYVAVAKCIARLDP